MAEEGLLSYGKVLEYWGKKMGFSSQKISVGLLAHPLSVSGKPRSLTQLT